METVTITLSKSNYGHNHNLGIIPNDRVRFKQNKRAIGVVTSAYDNTFNVKGYYYPAPKSVLRKQLSPFRKHKRKILLK